MLPPSSPSSSPLSVLVIPPHLLLDQSLEQWLRLSMFYLNAHFSCDYYALATLCKLRNFVRFVSQLKGKIQLIQTSLWGCCWSLTPGWIKGLSVWTCPFHVCLGVQRMNVVALIPYIEWLDAEDQVIKSTNLLISTLLLYLQSLSYNQVCEVFVKKNFCLGCVIACWCMYRSRLMSVNIWSLKM